MEYIFPRRRTRNHPPKKEKASDNQTGPQKQWAVRSNQIAGTAGPAASDQATRN
jgi:hypothetical protein